MEDNTPKQEPTCTPPVSIHLSRLSSAYPPENKYVADNTAVYEKWAEYLASNPPSDSRIKGGSRPKVHLRDYTMQQYTCKKDENLWAFDKETQNFHTQVAQNVIQDETQRRFVTSTIIDHLNKVDKSLRENDPGHIVGTGYTSDSHKVRSLTWGKNIKRKDVDLDSHAYKLSCAFDVAWRHVEPLLHPDVKADFEEARQKLGGLWMDAGARDTNGVLRYKIVIDGKLEEFETKTRAPASGVCAVNYSRHLHHEKNLNTWVIILNLSRSDADESYGGNFDVASYALMIPQRANQMIVYRSEDTHGTSLVNVEPQDKNPDFKQIGLAFLLAKSLKTEFDKEILHGERPEPRTLKWLEDPMLLDDEEVQLKPRATMSLIKPTKSRDGKKLYEKDMKTVYDFPPQHKYKDWTRAALLGECAKRVREGNMDKHAYAISGNKEDLTAALLGNDGDEVVTSRVPRKIATDDDVEMEDAGSSTQGIRGNINEDDEMDAA